MTAITITYTHVCMYVLARTWIGLRVSNADRFVSHMYNSVPQLTKPLTTSARTFDNLGLGITWASKNEQRKTVSFFTFSQQLNALKTRTDVRIEICKAGIFLLIRFSLHPTFCGVFACGSLQLFIYNWYALLLWWLKLYEFYSAICNSPVSPWARSLSRDLACVTGVKRRRGRRNSAAREGEGFLPASSHAPRSPLALSRTWIPTSYFPFNA